MRSKTIGIPWYARERYHSLVAVFDDGCHLPKTFDAWYAQAKVLRDGLEAAGARVVRVHIDPSEFLMWCQSHDQRPNAIGLQAFANWYVSGMRPSSRSVKLGKALGT